MRKLSVILFCLLVVSCGKQTSDVVAPSEPSAQIGTKKPQPKIDYSSLSKSSTGKIVESEILDDVIANRDKEKCMDLKEGNNREFCLDRVNYALATESHDSKSCSEITSPKLSKSCLSSVDAYHLQEGNCGAIGSGSLKESCELTKRIDSHTPVSPASCSKMNTVSAKKRCNDYVNFLLVESGSMDSRLCSSISNPIDRKNCDALIVKNSQIIKSKDAVETTLKSSKFANDADIVKKCSTASSEKYLNKCLRKEYTMKAVDTKNVSLCQKLPNQELVTSCTQEYSARIELGIFNEARSKKDPALCDRIRQELSKKQCKAIVSNLK